MGAPQAIFLDRDGTLIVHKPYLHRPEEVEILPGVSETLGTCVARGIRLFLFTNQSGVGRGWFTLEDVEAVHRRMLFLIGLGPDLFTAVCVAPEKPEEPSRYRKPSPRFIQEQMAVHGLSPTACWMIGDTRSDWQAGIDAGVRTLAVRSDLTTAQSEKECRQLQIPLVSGLAEAFPLILANA